MRMCVALWPDEPAEEVEPHIASILSGKPWSTLPLVIFVAEQVAGRDAELIGFIEVGLRSHAEGCDGRHAVGFIEGWYVHADHQRCSIGRRLVERAEQWSLEQGASEIASNTWIDHEASIRAHEAIGFEIADRTVHFRKALR